MCSPVELTLTEFALVDSPPLDLAPILRCSLQETLVLPGGSGDSDSKDDRLVGYITPLDTDSTPTDERIVGYLSKIESPAMLGAVVGDNELPLYTNVDPCRV